MRLSTQGKQVSTPLAVCLGGVIVAAAVLITGAIILWREPTEDDDPTAEDEFGEL